MCKEYSPVPPLVWRQKSITSLCRNTSVCVAEHPRAAIAEGGGHAHVAIDIIADELLALFNKRHQTAAVERLPSIVKVPESLKELNKKAYVPEVFGLGPYHHHHFNPNFNLRSHKLRALNRALGRSLAYQNLEATDDTVKDLLQQLRAFVSSFEDEIKACYSEDFVFDADVFMLDAVFLLELCFSKKESMTSDGFHPLLDYRTLSTCVGFSIRRDVFKLENQIPLSLLRKLITWKGLFFLPGDDPCNFDFAGVISIFPIKEGVKNLRQMMKEEPRPKHLIDCFYRCTVESMRNEWPRGQCSNEDESNSQTRTSNSRFWKRCGARCSLWIISLLLAVWRRTCLGKYCAGKRREKADEGDDLWVMPAAIELERAGIVLQVSRDNKLCFKEGRFKLRGHLHLPKLEMQDTSEVMLRNMMAYEECCVEPGHRFFNRYMSLMTALIQTENDAALLIRQGIIQNFLSNTESVARLFNGLNMFITEDPINEIDDAIVEKVRAYYKSSFRVMLRGFIQSHFAKPWHACATIAAVVVLVCTLVQAVHAVKSAKSA